MMNEIMKSSCDMRYLFWLHLLLILLAFYLNYRKVTASASLTLRSLQVYGHYMKNSVE